MTEDLFAKFVKAQNPVFDRVLAELRAGHKRSHWMWFIFPQLTGLGRSHMAKKFALSSLEEARAFLDHPLLGQRLRDATEAVLLHQTAEGRQLRSVHDIFGAPDDRKFHSSMTLFHLAAPDDPLFWRALDVFFAGELDEKTVAGK